MNMPPGVAFNARLAPDFLDFIVALDQHRVDAVLVGGYAVGVYGVVLATSDIDFLYRRTSANVQRLCRVLEAFGAPPTAIDPKALLTPDMVTMFGVPPFRIDLLNDISGAEFAAVWRGSHVVTLEGTPIRVIGLAELRANKASTARPRRVAASALFHAYSGTVLNGDDDRNSLTHTLGDRAKLLELCQDPIE